MPESGDARRFGDRRDGRQLRSLSPVSRLRPYLMPEWAPRLVADAAEVGAAEDWLRAARQAGWRGIGFLHIFIAAYIRTVSQYPALNRFVAGRKIFARNGIEVVMSVKRAPEAGEEETVIKARFHPADTVFEVYRKLGAKIDSINAGEDQGRAERTAESLMNLPAPLLRLVLWFFNVLDFFGLLPSSLLDLSPWHGSMNVEDLSIAGAPPFYRVMSGYGNLPLTAVLGAKRVAKEADPSGYGVERKYIDYKLVLDGRVADGVYAAEAMRFLKAHLERPAALETPPERVIDDVM